MIFYPVSLSLIIVMIEGCMRLRKLGFGQSVMCFAPADVDRSIRASANRGPTESIEMVDILHWAMGNTLDNIRHFTPHWAQQGHDYIDRATAWKTYSMAAVPSIDQLRAGWLQTEAKSLEQLYAPNQPRQYVPDGLQHAEISRHCRKLGVSIANLHAAHMEEEQEREVDHEVELEREVHRPPKSAPAIHQTHEDLRKFVKTGRIGIDSSAFVLSFVPLSEALTETLGEVSAWSPSLIATLDFATIIQASWAESSNFLRPVNWVITTTMDPNLLVLISPYEANTLLPDIRRSTKVNLHQYSPRVTEAMKPLDNFEFYAIPSLPSTWGGPASSTVSQLNLFAGQLYLADYNDYLAVCNFLGLHDSRFVLGMASSPFTKSPLPAIKELIALRRKGMNHASTHMGKLLHMTPLSKDDFRVN